MSSRSVLLVVGLLALGLVTGYAGSRFLPTSPPGGTPSPVLATPRVPSEVGIELAPDPDNLPLPEDVKLTTARLGTGRYLAQFPVPKGWVFSSDLSNEGKWKMPGYPSYTYLLRVEHVLSEHRSISSMLTARIPALKAENDQFEIIAQTEDSLEFTYITPATEPGGEQHFRHAFLKWLDLSGEGEAQIEIAMTGREIDAVGGAQLMERVAAGTRLVQ
ncbi:MAG: hypothetical protein ACI379_00620 [Nocardioides sp.]|uniref:hypothetical protein n=1 Tax=Nocardioides sp. TaxID=35761 RepID=UPI003F03C4D1